MIQLQFLIVKKNVELVGQLNPASLKKPVKMSLNEYNSNLSLRRIFVRLKKEEDKLISILQVEVGFRKLVAILKHFVPHSKTYFGML